MEERGLRVGSLVMRRERDLEVSIGVDCEDYVIK